MLEANQCKRLRTAFEHHCLTKKLFHPYKANVLLWLENSNPTKFDTVEERSKVVDYIWDNLWKIHKTPPF